MDVLLLKYLDVCISECLLDVTHINVRHLLGETGVSLELKLLDLWQVDGPHPMGIRGDSEAIFLELGDGEKIGNSSLVDLHLENSKVPDLGRQFHPCVTISADRPPCVANILEAPCDENTVVCCCTI